MKKTLIIIFAVAVLGGASLVAKNHESSSASGHLVGQSNSSSSGSQTTSSASSSGQTTSYKDGTYTGSSADTPYGTVQIAVVVSGGKITGVNFLRMPSDLGNSRIVTSMAEPLLKQTTLSSQSANIDFVSGATSTSYGYQQSLQAALDQAKLS